MQFFAPADKAAPLLRSSTFGPNISIAVVNQSLTDVFMSDNPAELDASATGFAAVGGIRVAANGGQVLWPATSKIGWFRAIEPWVAATVFAATGPTIVDKLGGVWQVTTAGTTSATYPFPATEPAVGSTQADNTVTWTFRGPANVGLNIMPG